MKKLLIPFVLCLLCVGGAYWYYTSTYHKPLAAQAIPTQVQEKPLEQPSSDAQGNITYHDSVLLFSLTYPGSYKMGKFIEGNSTVFLLQSSNASALQLTVSAFDEDVETLTEERVRRELPDMPMHNVRTVTLPNAKIPALAFESSSDAFGQSIEVWFVHKKMLYQASAYASQSSLMESVLGTLAFD